MPRTSAKQRRAQLELIAKRLSTGFTDTDIMNDLNIKRATFYHYKKQVYQIWGEIARKKPDDAIAFEADLFKDRLIRIHRIIELRLNDSKNDPIKDVADAGAIATQISAAIFKLEYEGLKASKYLRGAIVSEQEGLGRITDLGDVQSGLPARDIYSVPEFREPESEPNTPLIETNDITEQSSDSEEKVF